MTIDLINHPPHYKGNRFESIDVIEAFNMGFHLGNAWKYICRHQKKGGRQDIEKALWYLRRIYDEPHALGLQEALWEMNGKWLAEIGDIVEDFGLSVPHVENAGRGILYAASRTPSRANIAIAVKSLEQYLKESELAADPGQHSLTVEDGRTMRPKS